MAIDLPWDPLHPLHLGKYGSELRFYPLHDPLQAATETLQNLLSKSRKQLDSTPTDRSELRRYINNKGADHMYAGEEQQVATTIARWANTLSIKSRQ